MAVPRFLRSGSKFEGIIVGLSFRFVRGSPTRDRPIQRITRSKERQGWEMMLSRYSGKGSTFDVTWKKLPHFAQKNSAQVTGSMHHQHWRPPPPDHHRSGASPAGCQKMSEDVRYWLFSEVAVGFKSQEMSLLSPGDREYASNSPTFYQLLDPCWELCPFIFPITNSGGTKRPLQSPQTQHCSAQNKRPGCGVPLFAKSWCTQW